MSCSGFVVKGEEFRELDAGLCVWGGILPSLAKELVLGAKGEYGELCVIK
jgi:hypothetical protein